MLMWEKKANLIVNEMVWGY